MLMTDLMEEGSGVLTPDLLEKQEELDKRTAEKLNSTKKVLVRPCQTPTVQQKQEQMYWRNHEDFISISSGLSKNFS